jgi:uncharacterized protein YjiS (DUF1127 family)
VRNLNIAPDQAEPSPSPFRGGAISAVIRRTGRWFLSAQQQRTARLRLHELDDHTLSDIGLLRDQIDDVFRGAAGPQQPL